MRTPCQDGDGNDWFIARDGKQYPSDPFLTEVEDRNITMSVMWKADEAIEAHQERVRTALAAAERVRKRTALQKRRHAREACAGCLVRIECLAGAVERREPHGTWGGLLNEELQEVIRNHR